MSKGKKMIEDLKRLFIPKYADKQVEAIYDEAKKNLNESTETIARYNALLKQNGVVMRIAIATGHGDRRKG